MSISIKTILLLALVMVALLAAIQVKKVQTVPEIKTRLGKFLYRADANQCTAPINTPNYYRDDACWSK